VIYKNVKSLDWKFQRREHSVSDIYLAGERNQGNKTIIGENNAASSNTLSCSATTFSSTIKVYYSIGSDISIKSFKT
jgi:hypothetical protein